MSSSTVASRAARAGGTLVRGVRSVVNPSASRPAGTGHSSSGWLSVTVLCDPSDLEAAKLPSPLADLGDRIEVRVQLAPGGKGVELAVRPRGRGSSSGTTVQRLRGSDSEADLRSALRRAKQLLEVGEVLAVDPVPHGERTGTPAGALLEAWTRVAPKAGVR